MINFLVIVYLIGLVLALIGVGYSAATSEYTLSDTGVMLLIAVFWPIAAIFYIGFALGDRKTQE